jgi:hypothetical protein
MSADRSYSHVTETTFRVTAADVLTYQTREGSFDREVQKLVEHERFAFDSSCVDARDFRVQILCDGIDEPIWTAHFVFTRGKPLRCVSQGGKVIRAYDEAYDPRKHLIFPS